MALYPGLDFADSGLQVRYTSSDRPQLVDIHVRTEKVADYAFGPSSIHTLSQLIAAGAAGGAEYSPLQGAVQLVAEGDNKGPDFYWRLQVAGVCSRYLRLIVENLASCGGPDNPVVYLGISGEFWDELSPEATTQAQLLEWLESPDEYPGRWPKLSFDTDVSIRSIVGAELTVLATVPFSQKAGAALEGLCYQWLSATLTYVNRFGEPVIDDPNRQERLLPRCSWAGNEFCLAIEEYERTPEEAAAVLLNLLERFHYQITPLRSVTIRL